jgi:hypothetical protein
LIKRDRCSKEEETAAFQNKNVEPLFAPAVRVVVVALLMVVVVALLIVVVVVPPATFLYRPTPPPRLRLAPTIACGGNKETARFVLKRFELSRYNLN